MPQAQPKLHAFLAHLGIASRRKVEEMITAGQIQVNNEPAYLGQRVTPGQDVISVDSQVVSGKSSQPSTQKPVVFLINKPVGIVSTTSDELGRQTVIDFLKKQLPAAERERLPRLYPVGRLDLESEGLMILTNDGDLTNTMTHPSFEVPKTYHVTIDGRPTDKALAHLERGVLLKEGMTAPAEVEILEQHTESAVLAVTIHEGRNQQIRRMMRRVGYEVIRLRRVKLGDYTLDDLDGQVYRQVQ